MPLSKQNSFIDEIFRCLDLFEISLRLEEKISSIVVGKENSRSVEWLCNGCATVVQRLCNGCATVGIDRELARTAESVSPLLMGKGSLFCIG